MIVSIPLDQVTITERRRLTASEYHVADYADCIESLGDVFPPVLLSVASVDPPRYVPKDGRHRVLAYRMAGETHIPAIIDGPGARAALEAWHAEHATGRPAHVGV